MGNSRLLKLILIIGILGFSSVAFAQPQIPWFIVDSSHANHNPTAGAACGPVHLQFSTGSGRIDYCDGDVWAAKSYAATSADTPQLCFDDNQGGADDDKDVCVTVNCTTATDCDVTWSTTNAVTTQVNFLQLDYGETKLKVVTGYGLEVEDGTECVMLDASAITCDDATGCTTATVNGTNFSYRTATFDTTTAQDGFWTFELPDNFDATAAASVTYTWTTADACASNDDVCFKVDGGSVGNDAAWDAATLGGTLVGITDICNAASERYESAAFSFTHGMTAGERAILSILRFTTGTGDGCTADNVGSDVRLLAVKFCYEVDNVHSGDN